MKNEKSGPGAVQVIGARDLCDLLGISRAALSGFKDRGLAVRLGFDAYDLNATVTAYVAHLRSVAAGRGGEEHGAALTRERARLAKEQADEKELKNAILRGELLKADEVEATWSDFLRDLRSRMLALPSRAQVSAGLTQAQTLAVDREMRAALAEAGGDTGSR